MMSVPEDRILTYVRNLDAILGGGVPRGGLTVLAGAPGTGKTILSQQICFLNATPEHRAILFQTFSEPTAKTMRFCQQFSFFDPKKLEDGSVRFIDLGDILRRGGLLESIHLLMHHVKEVGPRFVVIDSFRAFEDLANSQEDLRKFSYEIAIQLMGWECTAFFLGEFSPIEVKIGPLFSIFDGLIELSLYYRFGEQQRFIQVVKMRGTGHSRDEHSMEITQSGLEVYAPRVTIQREAEFGRFGLRKGPQRAKLGISKLDLLLGEGVPLGSSFLVSGVAGTGKTLFSLEFIYRGALNFNQMGIYFSFEETEDRLRAEARGMGWEMDHLIDNGLIEIVFIPQPDILVEKHLLMIHDRMVKRKAARIAIDSVSLLVHKVDDPIVVREKIFQLATLVQNAQGVGFFATDIPYGSDRLSRFGVEETVVDGVILLTASEKGFDRDRYIEIYKLRNTAHLSGRHRMIFDESGITIVPRVNAGSINKKRGITKAS